YLLVVPLRHRRDLGCRRDTTTHIDANQRRRQRPDPPGQPHPAPTPPARSDRAIPNQIVTAPLSRSQRCRVSAGLPKTVTTACFQRVAGTKGEGDRGGCAATDATEVEANTADIP